jgi:NADH-quinone oxidoreductase subunit N
VYEGSPNIITYFFAVIPKLAITVVFFRLFFFVFFNLLSVFSFFILFCSIISIFMGSVLALYQVKIKRFLAYSAVVHMGYILLSLSLGSYASIYVAFYYLFVYILVSINIFTIFLILYREKGTPIKNIVEVANISHSNFFLAILFSLAILSVAGIPPLAGFFGKIYAFSFLIETGNYYLALFVVLISVLSCAYYIRLVRFILFREKNDKVPIFNYIHITEIQSILLIFLFFINFFFLFLQTPIILIFDNILLSLLV